MSDTPPANSNNTGHAGQRAPAAGARSFFGAASQQLDDWLAIEPDGTVTVFSGKVELGTGVRTALAQIVAEELDVSLARIRMVMGDTARTPNEGYTAGSMTVKSSGMTLRRAAATARQLLLEMAAAELGMFPDELTIRDGVITPRDAAGPRVTFAGLMAGGRFDRPISQAAPLKQPAEYQLVGTSASRLDLPARFTGQPSFVHDLRLPGMLHARVVRPSAVGAKLTSLDDTAVRDARIVRSGDFVAVVAEREEAAVRAVRSLQVSWSATPELPAMESLHESLRHEQATVRVATSSDDAESAIQRAATQLSATYTMPFQAHASIGPSCAVANFDGESLTVWCATQGAHPLREALAGLLRLPEERVRVIYMEGSGSYGHNGSDDVAADAAVLARELRQPVRVQWSRADEFAGEPKTPAMVMDLRGGLDGEGAISGWIFEGWSPSHGNRPRQDGDFLVGRQMGAAEPAARAFAVGGDRNAPTDYTIHDHNVTVHWLAREPLLFSSMRSLGAFANTFANESFMDELATAAGVDPLAFRLRYLDDPRGRAVLEAAARRAGWGEPLPAGAGRGLAFARYENTEAYVATVAEVAVDVETGAVRVRRMVVAHDCGRVINPDGVRNQIEGNVIQSLSRALKEEVRFTPAGVTSLDWESYPILTFSEIPEIIIELIDQPDQPPVGAGEPATVTTAPAVANAIYAACGARMRAIPLTPARVKASLDSQARK
ncbi:MAG TPA: molybdopterin cofactor-binding domain-containing protein [Ktedonobacterales bacterium]|jgi:CO/xanthine dehydrogenase Mo-binding subunit